VWKWIALAGLVSAVAHADPQLPNGADSVEAQAMAGPLVRAELVRRSEDPEDRRAKRVALTARGTSFVRKLEAARTREVAQVFNHLSSEARARLGDTLVLLIKELASLPCRTATGPASGAGVGARSSRAREPGPSGTPASSKPGPSARG